MPPKKRAAPAAPQPAKKKVRVGETSIIGAQDSTGDVHASGRPKRATDADPNYNTKRPRKPVFSTKAEVDPPKRGRGRPPTIKPDNDAPKSVNAAAKEPETVKRGAGRPPKAVPAAATPESEPESESETAVKKSAGRPKKPSSSRFTQVKKHKATETAKLTTTNSTASKTVGRRSTTPTIVKKTAGRPKGGKSKSKSKSNPGSKTKTTTAAQGVSDLEGVNGHGDQEIGSVDAAGAGISDEDDGMQYWLMKAEPESRIENGYDVKFSIDDLAARQEPEAWDGVRNYVARNNMRAMKKGDLAFFYHSNCKIPGIAGIMEIVQEHSPDESAFDPKHPYYDPKSSRDNPKWEVVHVEFARKFAELITLKELQSYAQLGGVLGGMQMLKQGRLSVSSVKPKEWKFILGLAQDKEPVMGDSSEEPEGNDENQRIEPGIDGNETVGTYDFDASNQYDEDDEDDVDRETTNIESNIGL